MTFTCMMSAGAAVSFVSFFWSLFSQLLTSQTRVVNQGGDEINIHLNEISVDWETNMPSIWLDPEPIGIDRKAPEDFSGLWIRTSKPIIWPLCHI